MSLSKKEQKAISVLALAYSFSEEEGFKKVLESKKVKNERVCKPKIALPYCGSLLSGCCMGISLNGRLYTQCLKKAKKGSIWCGTCKKEAEASSSGKPKYGSMEDRMAMGKDWKDSKQRAPVRYSTVMLKKNITKEQAVEEAAKLGWTIPEEEFELEVPKKKQGKKRGRPAKTKKVETGGAGDDLIANLVAQAKMENNEDADEIAAAKTEVVDKKAAKEAEKEAKKLAKEAEKLAKKEAKEAEKLAKKQAKEAEKLAKKQAKEAEKLAKEAEKEAKKLAKKAAKKAEKEAKEAEKAKVTKDAVADLQQQMEDLELQEEKVVSSQDEDEDEDGEVEVVKFEHEGKEYLKDCENIVYDMETQDEIGTWNETDKKIRYL